VEYTRVGKLLAGTLLALVVVVALLFVLGVFGVPEAEVVDNRWGDVDEERIELLTTVRIDNPNPLGVASDADIEYDIELQGVPIGEGERAGFSVPSGRSTHVLSTDMDQDRLPAWWSRHLNNGEVSNLRVNATAHTSVGPISRSPSVLYEDSIETNIEGALNNGFSEFEGNYSRSLGGDIIDSDQLEFRIEIPNVTVNWGEVNESQTEILVSMDIHNPNAYPIPTPAFTGDLTFNEVPLADWEGDEVDLRDADDALIQSGTTETRTFVVLMDNRNVSEWFPTHVDRNEQTDIKVSTQLALKVGDRQITFPRKDDGLVCEFALTTDIFVDQEPDMRLDQCETAALETTPDELDAASAVLDLNELDVNNSSEDERK
jgi:LEA14-like dessication related protein